MEYKDYYKTIGVEKNADEKEIKKAYRRLARQFHPDVNPGDKAAEARFKEINEANQVLSDPEKRRKYDELGHNYQRWQQTGGQPGGFDWGQWAARGQPGGVRVGYGDLNDLFGGSGFSDFFEAIFGGMGAGARDRGQAPPRLRDMEHEVEVTLEEAFRGAQRLMEVDGHRLEVKIPAGVKTGSRVRMAGEGLPGGKTGPRGDIYLRTSVLPHATFERQGDNLQCEIPTDLFTALLGGEVRVPTLSGAVALRIPAGTQSGRTFRLAGQGMPKLRAPQEHGDLYAKIRVMLPEELSDKERKLIREWAEIRGVSR
ncbi:MAG: molecular chaperone DnaJ [Chloroflexi bacterium HGW-Chloroflexi-1]|nr:MAG: molecular chaperone DnaJ [Chloroflexi bacterium HGW-Chloroflexi-1]